MKFIIYVSDFIIPLTIFYIIGFAVLMRRPVYDDFVAGAKKGAKTVADIMPTLIGLMVGVGILRSSGFLDALAETVGGAADKIGVSSEIIPVIIVKLFSSSAATGLALDIFKEYGTDSGPGLTVSIMLSCTETIFYTMSVYFMTAKVTKTRWTLPGALLSTLTGIIASIILAGIH